MDFDVAVETVVRRTFYLFGILAFAKYLTGGT
jgi:hypothetical protein